MNMSPKYTRALTPPPVPTPEHNLMRIELLDGRVEELQETVRECRDLLIELTGRDGKGGKVQELKEEFQRSAESQGTRIEQHTADIATLKQTRAILLALGALSLALLGALAKALL